MTADAIRDRIATIASEAFGPFPAQTVEEDLTAIERGIHETGKAREEWRARAEKLQQADEMDHRGVLVEKLKTKNTELRSIAGELLESARLANTTSDGYRDAHAAYQRWAAVHAPDAIGDEQKREVIDRLLRARPPLDPTHVETLRGMLADDRHMLETGERVRSTTRRNRIAALTAVLGEQAVRAPARVQGEREEYARVRVRSEGDGVKLTARQHDTLRGTTLTRAAFLSVFTAACALVDRDGPLVEADRRRDPLCVAVDAARGMTAVEAIERASRDHPW